MDYEIIVGVSSKDCEKTIAKVVKTIDNALSKYYSKQTSLILCSDGFSSDKTKTAFNDVKTITEKKFLTEKGKRGKGSAVKTIIQRAKMHGSMIVLLIDGDHLSLKEEWIKKMIDPVLKNEQDIVVPNYIQDKNDSLISNHLIYPLTKTLFNVNLRNPMAGEFCISKKSYMNLLNSKFFPSDSGLDIFITLTGLCENLNFAEVKLGIKDHASSKKYARPEDSIMPMFNQVLREFIQLIRYYKASIKKEVKFEIKKLGKFETQMPKKVIISIKAYKELSRNSISDESDYAKKVYESLNDQSIMGLKVAWLNWLAIYFDKTKNLSNDKAEAEIEKLVKAFQKNKELLKL